MKNEFKRSRLARRAESAMRAAMCTLLSRALPLVIVNEYPKSGGSWLASLLSEYLQLPFPRNRFPQLRPSIMQTHYLPKPGLHNIVCMFRDGRDVMVSFYYHSLFENNRENAELVRTTRAAMQFADDRDIRANLPRFIEYKFTTRRQPHFTWREFALEWYREGVPRVRYEELLNDTAGQLKRVIEELRPGQPVSTSRLQAAVENNSFSARSGRAAGDEQPDNFLRKGVSGDWKDKMSLEARQVFDHHAGDALRLLGYEPEKSDWVLRSERCTSRDG